MSQASLDFNKFDAESYIVKRIGQHGAKVFDGCTDSLTRKDRIRAAILEAKLDLTIIGRNSATQKTETYAECFERLYGEPLVAKQTRKQRHAQADSL